MREEDLSADSQAVLRILRDEAEEGKITEKQRALLEKAVLLHDSLGIIGSFVIKFAAFLTAITLIIAYWPKRNI